jgi:DNA-binding IclR family transcriptional regulator
MNAKIDQSKKDNKKKGKSTYKPLVPSVDQASRILICLGKGSKPRLTLTEICREVDIHKSKGYSILNTLTQFGFVEKDLQTKTYSLGPVLLFLSRNVLDNLDLRVIVTPFLQKLATETNSTALFGLVSADQIFIIAKHEGDQDIGVTIRLGHRFHITSGAHGKAIVAFMPEVERQRILARKNLYFYGDISRLNRERLTNEFAKCRDSGFAQDIGEMHPGINSVSAPVLGPHGKIVGCIILVGTFSESLIEKYGLKVSNSVKRISYKLGADVDTIYGHAGKGRF